MGPAGSSGGDQARVGPRARLAVAVVAVVGVCAALLSGFFRSLHTLGAHDWDQMESHRHFVAKSIRVYGQFPTWDPYGCGGFPTWGSPEGASTVISPVLPFYLLLPLEAAVRAEVVFFVVALVLGTWFLARVFVKDPIAIAFVCVVGALSSRVALQIAVGHTWHQLYAGLPWVLGAYLRATPPGQPLRARWIALGAAVFALMVYGNGIYPVPHTALCVVFVAGYRAWAARSLRPILGGAWLGGLGAALAAPKALAIADALSRFPRHVRSRETIDPLSWPKMFLWSADDIPGFQIEGLDWMWHEYGQYVGPIALGFVLAIVLRRRLSDDPTVRALRFTGWAFMALALGGWGPWLALHLIPPFSSQHVPSRFTLTAFLLFAIVAATVAEQSVAGWRARAKKAWQVDAALGAGFVLTAAMIAQEDARATRPWFSLEVPAVAEREAGYVQYDEVPAHLRYGLPDPRSPRGVDGPPELLARRANVGTITCIAFPGMNFLAPKGENGRPPHQGARGIGDPAYRGEVWVDGAGEARIARWTPKDVTVEVRGAAPGARLVLNQNWDAGWTANGAPALAKDDVVTHPLRGGDETVQFVYHTRTLGAGLAIAGAGLAAAAAALALRRARRSRLGVGAQERP